MEFSFVLICKNLYNEICILKNEHKKLSGEYKTYPYCYMLGKNKQNIIEKMINLKQGGGYNCHRMIAINAFTMTEGMVNLIKKWGIRYGASGFLKIQNF